ncbi:pentapeptide repeat-containing protein [Streptosporangium canum]|uniref:pentapeptide repeat-containing protein n=1 Tax=Streptosporangium canum TaxID=324952 RepID=UPI00342DACB9
MRSPTGPRRCAPPGAVPTPSAPPPADAPHLHPPRPAPISARTPKANARSAFTAQRILTDHLRDDRPADQRSALPAAPTFWEGMRLDLTGATLIDFDLTDGHVTDARFDGATFTGTARFDRVTFPGNTWFGGATFAKGAWFEKVTFTEYANFHGATFTETPLLGGAVVIDPEAAHVWPNGWRLERTPEGTDHLT